MQHVIEIEKLNKSFGDNHVLRDFSLSLSQGETIAVLGKSGSGKSVLIKCIVNLVEADEGKIIVLGEDISELKQEALDSLRAKVGFLFQSNALYDSMTVRENLEFPLRMHWPKEKREAEAERAVMEVLTDVGLAHTADMMPEELSGGMRKRIALARTLILRPAIILYDEPTTGLDPVTARGISQLIVNVQKKYNTSSIVISHDLRCIEATAGHVIMLIDGRCYALDTFSNLEHTDDPKIREFFD
ncbi:MAG TPA: ATP-binding cassette domain-containing protein [Cyclobacteriaceae bacterium]|nr:ATP-binding cassette domain-containing protein [Cyclobacteriaceae bacterium]HMV08531.1 ATP-binding cassette domain-containing protein [Cyclobacteriaceae bacterium]HMV90019.1 ATP-binding cassette domain-containing protein [Cyclobacteriaceae bacterium]HMX01304.1 ATP-binding cassette domain-containing protein [Cyclobacteriaceae bacterium]HMX51282.1 ATP-binding cassette domain-containing protein [Cyclobacteriaceae bacterium]